MLPVHFSRLSGFGPLPRLFEAEVNARVLDRVLADEGIYLSGSSPTTPVPFARMNAAFNRAAQINGDVLFPLRVARAMRPEDYGPFARFALQAPTLADGIRRIARLGPLQNNACRFRTLVVGGTAFWHLDYIASRGQRIDAHALHVLLPMIDFVRRFAVAGQGAVMLHVTAPTDPGLRLLEQALEMPVRGGAASACVTFPAAWLRLRGAGGLPGPRMTYAEMIAGYRSDTLPRSVTEIVAALVVPSVGHADVGLDVIAGRLNVSRRTLQQRLGAEGASFRDILLRVRMERARRLIAGGEGSMAQVALAVGYSDQAHFSRAFKTQTGLTPQEYRRWRGGLAVAAE